MYAEGSSATLKLTIVFSKKLQISHIACDRIFSILLLVLKSYTRTYASDNLPLVMVIRVSEFADICSKYWNGGL